MTIIEMLEQSGIMALVGMGVVFSFLIIMVIAITISSSLIRKFEKSDHLSLSGQAVISASSQGNAADGAITAAITAAVNEFRKNK